MRSAAQNAAEPELQGLETGSLLPPFHTAAQGVRRRTWRTRFLPEHLYEYYARQTAITLSSLPPGHVRLREIPPEFTELLPLDKNIDEASAGVQTTGTYGYVTSVYKAISTTDGFAYALRRVENVRTSPAVLEAAVSAWSKAAHPSVITLRRAFHAHTGRGGGPGSNAVIFLHDYYPGARSLKELYMESRGPAIPESTLWSFVCQIVSGLRAVHDAKLSFRGLRASHVLVTGHGRVRLAGAGVLDVLEADSVKVVAEMQAADLLCLGHLLLQLAVRSPNAHLQANIVASLELARGTYSPALHNLIVLLASKPMTIDEVMRLLAPHFTAELDRMYDHADAMDHLLSREADNGRLLRALLKLGFVNERAEYDGDPSWAETGDRYLLKLYRDFLFHQTADDGRPVLDVGHVVDSLNHLDCGTPQKVLLCSRDGANLLVSSYATLRTAVNAAFEDLTASARKHSGGHAGAAAEADGGIGEADSEWLRRNLVPKVVRDASGKGMRGRARAIAAAGGSSFGVNPLAPFGMLPGMNMTAMLMGGAGGGAGGGGGGGMPGGGGDDGSGGMGMGMIGGMGMGMGMGMGGEGYDASGQYTGAGGGGEEEGYYGEQLDAGGGVEGGLEGGAEDYSGGAGGGGGGGGSSLSGYSGAEFVPGVGYTYVSAGGGDGSEALDPASAGMEGGGAGGGGGGDGGGGGGYIYYDEHGNPYTVANDASQLQQQQYVAPGAGAFNVMAAEFKPSWAS